MTTVKPATAPAQDKFMVAAKSRLIELGLSITKLAKELGVSRQAASQAINNNLHQPTRERIAAYLQISVR